MGNSVAATLNDLKCVLVDNFAAALAKGTLKFNVIS
jgi:hypothetical protein